MINVLFCVIFLLLVKEFIFDFSILFYKLVYMYIVLANSDDAIFSVKILLGSFILDITFLVGHLIQKR